MRIDAKTNGIVLDLATHPVDQFAVILRGLLLPIRYASRNEAATHLMGLLSPEEQDTWAVAAGLESLDRRRTMLADPKADEATA